MTALNQSTRRRLQKLHQIPSVWEGDRRSVVPGLMPMGDQNPHREGECILWVDGTQAIVRAIDMAGPSDAGPEAIVRTLIRAMEQPHHPAKPARPQKIVVRDRELQFFLRGVLQDLDIAIDHVPSLPLIDDFFRGFQQIADGRLPELPDQYAELLEERAYEIWRDAPWNYLADHHILSIELNQWDLGTLYASVMGMLGQEYGVLLYRSLESLKQFRQQAYNSGDSLEEMEAAFLKQDCLFVTFDRLNEDDEDDGLILADLSLSEIQPSFGNLHPLEGLRPFLDEEESLSIAVALDGLHRFLKQHHRKLSKRPFPALNSRYQLTLPGDNDGQVSIPVSVATLPELSAEISEMLEAAEAAENQDQSVVRDDLLPDDCMVNIGMIPWKMLEVLRGTAKFRQPADVEIPPKGDGLPVIMVQASLPKAKALVQALQAVGGLKAVCFNPGASEFDDDDYDVGMLLTGDDTLYLFGEFPTDDATHSAARKKWDQRCKNTGGYCALVVAKGLKGANRGNPVAGDMYALFEVRSLFEQDLKIGTLRMRSTVEWF